MAWRDTSTPLENTGNMPARADRLEQELRAALEPGERILWKGYPRQGLMLGPQDAFLIPFSLMWGGFAIFWEFSVVTSAKSPIFFDLWGIPFVLIGLHMIFGRFFVDAKNRAGTIYALTDQRVLILSGLWRRSIRSLELAGLSEINLTERPDGRGTITFGSPSSFGMGARGWPPGNRNLSPSLDGVAQARDVLKKIRDAQRTLARSPNT